MMNKEEYLEYQRRYREEHKEELRAKNRVRYQKNKEYYTEYNKNYYLKNKEKIKDYYKRSYSYVSVRGNEEPIQTDLFEIWKDINEDYCVSNYGKVWSRKRNKLVGFKSVTGYMEVMINGTRHYIHRLVAQAFIPNPNNYPEIDHLDADRSNNVWTNLRWTDRKGNQNNPITKTKMKESNKGKLDKAHKAAEERQTWKIGQKAAAKSREKRVFQYTIDGVFVKEYSSTVEAAKEVGCTANSIAKCCRGKYKTTKDYVWKYADAA